MQDSQGQADHLQVLTSSGGGDVTGLCADIVDDGLLQPGDQEVGALVDDLLLDTGQPVEDDSPRTTSNVVEGVVEEHNTGGRGDGQPVEVVETVCRHDVGKGDGDECDGDGRRSRGAFF